MKNKLFNLILIGIVIVSVIFFIMPHILLSETKQPPKNSRHKPFIHIDDTFIVRPRSSIEWKKRAEIEENLIQMDKWQH